MHALPPLSGVGTMSPVSSSTTCEGAARAGELRQGSVLCSFYSNLSSEAWAELSSELSRWVPISAGEKTMLTTYLFLDNYLEHGHRVELLDQLRHRERPHVLALSLRPVARGWRLPLVLGILAHRRGGPVQLLEVRPRTVSMPWGGQSYDTAGGWEVDTLKRANLADAAMPSWTARPQPGKGTPSRVAANAAEDVTLTTNERILRDIHGLYVDAADGGRALEEPIMSPAALRPGKEGIMAICSKLGMSCIAPRRKINVMVVGAPFRIAHAVAQAARHPRDCPPSVPAYLCMAEWRDLSCRIGRSQPARRDCPAPSDRVSPLGAH